MNLAIAQSRKQGEHPSSHSAFAKVTRSIDSRLFSIRSHLCGMKSYSSRKFLAGDGVLQLGRPVAL